MTSFNGFEFNITFPGKDNSNNVLNSENEHPKI